MFYDPLCPAPYTLQTLESQALGGSEASAVRIAEALDACVMQHCRQTSAGRYRAPSPEPRAEHVVLLRDARALGGIRHWFPNARFHVWLHDRLAPGSTRARWLAQAGDQLAGGTLICVSDFLRLKVEAVVRGLRGLADVEVRRIYNPIDDALAPGTAPVDHDKMVFLSSPNKGLNYALTAFAAMRRAFPSLRLYVANPGYRHAPTPAQPNVVWVGRLTPAQTMDLARSAHCVFMPNFVLPETFGLVFAEANAVGTPVLAHDSGAAREVLHADNPVLPVLARQRCLAQVLRVSGWRARQAMAFAGLHCGAFDDYIELLAHWRNAGRPSVAASPQFRLSRVANEWRALLR